MGSLGFGARLALRQPAQSGGAAAIDFTGGTLPAGVTLLRASPGGRVNAAGAFVVEAADVARFDHDPVTRLSRGLLFEPGATNVLLQSGTASGWTVSNMTRGGGAAFAGAPELAVFTQAAGTGLHRLSRAAGDGEGSFTLSLFVRGSAAAPVVGLTRETIAWFNTQTGQWLATGGFTSAVAVPLGDGAWRLAVSYDLPAGAPTVLYVYASNRAATVPSPGFAGGEEMWLGGLQVEAGAIASSAIATTGAPVTRAADQLTIDWASRGVADGAITARVTFDDLTTQDVAVTVAGGVGALPATLARPRIRRIERI